VVSGGATIGEAFVTIRPDLSGFEQAISTQARTSLAAVGQSLQSAGAALTAGLTVPLAAIGGLSLKAAVDFESSFAGIRKTMDLTEEQFAALAETNRELAQQIPVTVNELNRIGELGGQLGIGIDNLVDFEKTVAALAVATNLTADQAALAFAQIANVIQLPQDQISNLAAAVVGLGNSFATQESAIVEFAQRIAGAGQIVGLTAGDIAGIATAFSSLGIEAEAGGSAVQRVLLELNAAAINGGESLQRFADTAGLSIEQFRALFERDAAGAFIAFVDGLATQGNRALGTLEELGLSDIRLTRALLSAAGAGDVLNRAIQQGNRDFAEGTAHITEFEKRAETTASDLQEFRNRLNDVAIEFGQSLAPALVDALDAMQPFVDLAGAAARAFADLPGPIQTAALAAGLAGATLGPLLLAIGLAAPGIVTTAGAISGLASSIGTLNAALAASPLALAGIAAAVTAVGTAFITYRTLAEAAAEEGRVFGRTVEEAVEGGANAIRATIQDLEGLAASLDADIASFRQAGQDTSELEAAAAELRTEIAGLREELNKANVTAAEMPLDFLAAGLDKVAGVTRAAGDAARDSAGGVRTLSEELAELSPRILATTLAANLLQQAAGVRGIGGSIELLRSTADAIGAIQQQFAQQQQIEAFADMLLRAAGAGDLARDAVEGVGGAARRATSGVADLARSVGELTSRSLALEAAQQLISRGVRSVEGAMRAIHPAALELIRDLAQSEDLAQKIADAFLGVRDSLRETASAATGGGDLLGLLASRRLAAGLDAGGGLFTPQGGGPVDQSVHIDSVTIQTTPEAVAAAADVPTLGVALRESFWGAT